MRKNLWLPGILSLILAACQTQKAVEKSEEQAPPQSILMEEEAPASIEEEPLPMEEELPAPLDEEQAPGIEEEPSQIPDEEAPEPPEESPEDKMDL
ncbi:MAG: hypothetical protein HY611_02795 [Elusimicrobia bacterium]|nr:hypothetical protein [Elusimicrobiota bacterium]